MKKVILLVCFLFSPYVFALAKNTSQIIEITVTDKGFEPSQINVSSETPVILKVTRKTRDTCATSIQLKDKNIKKELPLNKTVTIELGEIKKGDIKFSCGMDMIKGSLHVK